MNAHAGRTLPWLALVMLLGLPLSGSAGGLFDFGKDLLKGLTGSGSTADALSNDDIAGGLREALTVGTGKVVEQLGQTGGFANDPAIRVRLPEKLGSVQKALSRVGMSDSLDELEAQMNAAAEVATPKAKALFLDAISQMTLDDVKGIYTGPEDAATRYFQSKMSAPLAEEMNPIVADSLANVGAVKTFDKVMGRYEKIPFVPDVKADLTGHVVDQGIDGIFHYLAKEEAAIRSNPAARTTALLKKVFGAAK